MASRIRMPKTGPDFLCDMITATRVHGASDVADDCFTTVIHHATVVVAVAVA